MRSGSSSIIDDKHAHKFKFKISLWKRAEEMKTETRTNTNKMYMQTHTHKYSYCPGSACARFNILHWLLAAVFPWFLFRGVQSLILLWVFFTPETDDILCAENWCWYEYCYYCIHMAFGCSTSWLLLLLLLSSASIKVLCVYEYVQYSTVARRIDSVASWRPSIRY